MFKGRNSYVDFMPREGDKIEARCTVTLYEARGDFQLTVADVRTSMQLSELRQTELARERKPLLEEAEFYKGKALPAKLRQQLDANEAATAAQRDVQNNQKAELERVTKLFDVELARLKRLWAGAAPGSIGPSVDEAASAAGSAPAKPVVVRKGK